MKARLVPAAAFLAFAVLGLYPPWNYTHRVGAAATPVTRPAPRAWIFVPPEPAAPDLRSAGVPPGYRFGEKDSASALDGVVLAGGRLIVEWLVVAALGAAGYILARRRT
jgi:hypothetical protein